MSEKSRTGLLMGLVLAVSLIAASVSALLTARAASRVQFQTLSALCGSVAQRQPDAEQAVLDALKDRAAQGGDYLARYGYRPADFSQPANKTICLFIAAGFIAGAFLFALILILGRRRQAQRIQTLVGYMESINTGHAGMLLQNREDDFSKLQDEIYKTVTSLYQTRDAALRAKRSFAENLYNIAHQLKTPVTSISLSLQMMKKQVSSQYPDQIEKQLSRLTHLEEALLLLSRVDAGTLPLSRQDVDIFTVLTLAADDLHEVMGRKGVCVDIPELGEAVIQADMEWTMEAVMNLLKDCAEHSPAGGTVHCSYEQNPLYSSIRIWDEGPGFAQEDLPHLFERFYRGQNAAPGGIGIGLALAKEIIELQNGTIRAQNHSDGGAEFEIHFYCH